MAAEPISDELQFLLDRCRVPEAVVQALQAMGATDIRKFSLIDDTRADVRATCKEEFGLDPTARRGDKGIILSVIDAWEQACKRANTEREEEALAKQLRTPQVLSTRSHLDLRVGFEKRWYKLEEGMTPSPYLVEVSSGPGGPGFTFFLGIL